MPTKTYPAEGSRRYDPGAAIHPIHTGYTFRPSGKPPADGWPLVIVFSVGGFQSTNVVTELTPLQGVVYRLIHELRVAVFWCWAPVSRSDTLSGLSRTDQNPAAFNPNAGELGEAYPKGNGNIVQHTGVVGVDWPGANPSGYGGTHPWADPFWVMPEKAGCWAVQHAKANASTLVSGGIDPNRIGTKGFSAGSLIAGFPAMMPDMQGEFGDGTIQGLESTEVRAAALGGTLAYWPIYSPPDMVGYHFYNKTASPTYDDVAETLDDVFLSLQHLCSPAIIMSDIGQPGLVAAKSSTSYLIRVGDAPDPATLAVPDRYDPVNSNNWAVGVETVVHTSAHGYLLKSLWRDHPDFELMITKPEGVDPNAAGAKGVPADYEAPDTDSADEYELGWWSRVLLLDAAAPSDPVKELVLDRLEEELRRVTEDNGYRSNVRTVLPLEELGDDTPVVYPCVFTGDEDVSPGQIKGPGKREESVTVRMVCLVAARRNADGRRARNRLEADVRKATEGNWHASYQVGADGLPMGSNPFSGLPVTDVEFLGSRAFSGRIAEDDVLGSEVVIRVDYRTSLVDPYLGP